jgi:hypothetical protein
MDRGRHVGTQKFALQHGQVKIDVMANDVFHIFKIAEKVSQNRTNSNPIGAKADKRPFRPWLNVPLSPVATGLNRNPEPCLMLQGLAAATGSV